MLILEACSPPHQKASPALKIAKGPQQSSPTYTSVEVDDKDKVEAESDNLIKACSKFYANQIESGSVDY